MPDPVVRVASIKLSETGITEMSRVIPEERAVAFVFDGSTHAVMMATPRDLSDFATGFSITEGLIQSADEIKELDIVEHEQGIELRMWLTPVTGRTMAARRRRLAGPTGCGLCGIESLEAASAAPKTVAGGTFMSAADIRAAMASLAPAQVLNSATRAVHAAAFWTKADGLVTLREDVGRHNALDKLAGALKKRSIDAGTGVVVLTSRVSVEMIQKSAAIGAPIVVAVSAPTALAIRTAEAAGITLIAVARSDAFEVFTHPHRVLETATKTNTKPGWTIIHAA